MKILILTQIVDEKDPVLGYFHNWLGEFAKSASKVTVICLKKGEHNLPANVRVLSLGKEGGKSRLKYIFRFYRYIFAERKNYDAVFVHMNPEYIVLGGPLFKLWGKRIVLWYVHRQANLKLRIAEKFADVIFTVAKESFTLKSEKVRYVGHGVDTEKFTCGAKTGQADTFKVVSVGRITKIKNIDTLIAAAKIIKEKSKEKISISIVGGPVGEDDDKYFDGLKKMILREGLGDIVWFKGAVSFEDIKDVYCGSDLSVNLTPTGGIDKAVLESMSCGVPTLVSNEAFRPIFGAYAEHLIFRYRDARDLADKILFPAEHRDPKLPLFLRGEVAKNHSVGKPVSAILSALKH